MNIGTSLEKAIKSVYQIIRRSLSEDNLKNTKSLAYLFVSTSYSVLASLSTYLIYFNSYCPPSVICLDFEDVTTGISRSHQFPVYSTPLLKPPQTHTHTHTHTHTQIHAVPTHALKKLHFTEELTRFWVSASF